MYTQLESIEDLIFRLNIQIDPVIKKRQQSFLKIQQNLAYLKKIEYFNTSVIKNIEYNTLAFCEGDPD